ncbi:maleylpyruvate isomerase [Roseibium hamelinense]|uniref:Maleylpyruvate isomerase n=1 Tax=Roseibium hamelinense TaxID=150831 RepID=A0A562T0Q8_9HYPH|nr:maleylpyruvate isomerase [Roseibium hamelinense]
MHQLTLHTYFRSSTSFRARAALNLKVVNAHQRFYHLKHGQQRAPGYLDLNPQGLVPTLQLPDGVVLTQSLAIIEFLEESVPNPPLLPKDPIQRARARALALMIACDIHPINNLKVLEFLKQRFNADGDAVKAWFSHWVTETFDALEVQLSRRP